MATIKKVVCLRPEQADFLKTRRHISLSKIVQAAVYSEMRREGIAMNDQNGANRLLSGANLLDRIKEIITEKESEEQAKKEEGQ